MPTAQILVVEDEGVVAKSIQNDLLGMGYRVPEVASSGEEAIEQAEGTHPDLVLMDVVLKGKMDGIEAAEQIRQKLDVPIVYLTAYEDADTLSRAKLTEPFGYLLKPFEERELHATIEMALYKHRLEAQIKASERWLATTLQSIAEGMIATDSRLRVRLVNPAAERFLGCRAEDVFGKELTQICMLARGDEPTKLESLATEARRTNQSVALSSDLVLVARDGRETPIEGSLAPISDEGHACGFVLILRDISDRKAMESARRQNEAHVRQAQKMEAVSRLAGGVAHDFNNLLTVILGNTSLVRSQLPAGDPNADMLAAVETAADRAALRVEQLLAVSGHTRLRLEPLNLSEHMRDLIGLLRKGIAARIDVEFNLADDLWTVQADRAQIAEILANLCQNAQDAMPSGGRLSLETRNVTVSEDQLPPVPAARPGEYVRVRARDSGRGMQPEVRERIYEPYFSTKGLPEASGLGLALVYRMVEQHHGWIECTSDAGQGTCFDIYLPRYLDVAPLVQPMSEARRNSSTTVLLADDEPLVRDLGRAILEGQGYHVLLAEDGLQAVETFQRERYRIDLVILDLAMPRLSGADACRQMLEIDPGVRVLFSSAYTAADAPGGDDRILGYVRKPYRLQDLTGAVHAALEQVNVPKRDLLLMLAKRLEQALDADAAGPTLDATERVSPVLERVEQMLKQHLGDVEAPDGLFADVDKTKPSEGRNIDRLRKRYTEFLEQARVLRKEVDAARAGTGARNAPDHAALRERLRAFVADLESYRQEEINLVLETATTDIGGGD
jgi:two-component system, cell cycle sensor histidine kinase and response regulator CckA